MEQKDYKLEIVGVLLRGNFHIREIAKQLKINHMMIVRKIKELFDSNIVDFRKEGQNTVYFLRDNSEAKAQIFIFEQYNLINFLIKFPGFKEIIRKIQMDKRIKLALIFGSYAKGLEHKSSDLDLYLESSDLKLKEEYSKLDSKLSIKLGKFDKNSLLIKEMIKNHIIIKGGERYYEQLS